MKKIVMRDWYFYELIETTGTIVLEKLRFIKCPFTSRQKICFHINQTNLHIKMHKQYMI